MIVRSLKVVPLLASAVVLAGCGAGAIEGAVSLSPGVPPPTYKGPCITDNFSFTGTATGELASGGKTFVGALKVSSSGTACDLPNSGSGTLTASASGTSAGTSISCPTLAGTLSRLATDVSVKASGTCTATDKKGTVSVFETLSIGTSQFIPTKLTNGNVTGATFAGDFTAS